MDEMRRSTRQCSTELHWIMIRTKGFAAPLAVFGLLAQFADAQQPKTTMFPAVRASHEMVAAGNNFEVEAGYRILQQGGNAVDAGVAATLAALVTEQDHFGLGGEVPIIIKLNGKAPVVISGVGVAPKLATSEFFNARKAESWEDPKQLAPIPEKGILCATVPGVFDGLMLALEKYGTMSFAQVAAPAIERADGFPLTEIFSNYIRANEAVLKLWPTSSEFFLPGGKVPDRGTVFHEPALAKTLRELVAAEKKAHGKREAKIVAVRNYFYQGSIARRIGEFSEKNGGLIRYEDMAAFHAETDTPRTSTYRGYEILKPGFWTQGPVMLEALNMLEAYDLKAMGHNSPEYLHTVVEVVKLAFADRDRYYGDPKFSTIPEEKLLSKGYAEERRKQIDPQHASMESRPGAFGGPVPMPRQTTTPSIGVQDTTCVNAADRFGNIYSSTPSGGWLPSVIAGDTGIPFTSRLQSLLTTPGHPNTLQGGKRPRVTLSPTLVLKDGKPVWALSTPGGDNQDQALLQVLLNLVDFGMSPQEAVEAPRFQTEHFYASFAMHEFVPGKLNLEGRIAKETADKLTGLGHKVTMTGDWSNSSAPTVIHIGDGFLEGGADPRRGRFVFGN
jgi:gamma-glutamyltranspeptidase / glutathione hydrolase